MSLLMWSGGCDSSLVLAEHLKLGQPIRTIGVSHNNIRVSSKLVEVRKKIMEWYGSVKWAHSEIELTHGKRCDVDAFDGKEGGLVQPGIWLSVASQYLDREEDLILAYIKGDDVWHRAAAPRCQRAG